MVVLGQDRGCSLIQTRKKEFKPDVFINTSIGRIGGSEKGGFSPFSQQTRKFASSER